MGLLFEKQKARQKPDGTFTPAPAEDTPMLSDSSLNVPRPEYPDKVEVGPVSQTNIEFASPSRLLLIPTYQYFFPQM